MATWSLPAPLHNAPLKNLSGKLPRLKINCGIEILKMSCFGQAEGNGLEQLWEVYPPLRVLVSALAQH